MIKNDIKILVVDDIQDNLISLNALIKRLFPEAIILNALNGAMGIELANKHNPDVILLDVVMPDMDGFEVCQKLKNSNTTNNIPIAFVTAIESNKENRLRAMKIGVDGFISKPINEIELNAQIRAMVKIKIANNHSRDIQIQLDELVALRTTELNNTHLGTLNILEDLKSENKARAKSEEFVGKILASNNDCIEVLNINGNLLTMRGGAQKSLEIEDISKYHNKLWLDFWDKKDRRAATKAISKAKNNGIGKFTAYRKTEKNRLKWWDVIVSPINNAEGKIENILVISRDVSERKKSENLIKASEELNRSITQTAADAIISVNAAGTILSWNNAAEKIFGYSSKEMINNKLNRIMPSKYFNGHKKGLARLAKGGKHNMKNNTVEISAIRKDGKEFPIELSLSKWESEEESFYTGIIRDITERKRSENIQKTLLKISNATITINSLEKLHLIIKEELSNIIDTTNYYIATYDELTDTISLQYFIDKHDEIKTFPAGKTITSYVIKTKQSLLATETIQNQMAEKGFIDFIGTRSKVWLGVPLKTANKIIGVLAVQSYDNENAFDNSDKKILEFIADQISISIDRKKTEEDLSKALINATESDRLKSAFLATMSHELRTPLNAVIGFSEILLNMDYSKEVTDYAKIINSSGSNLLNIIEDIFDITLIESGETTVRKTKGNLNTYLNSIHKSASIEQQRLKQTHISLNVILPKENEDLIINVDFPKLKHILLNLIKNGLKFSKKGHVTYGYDLILEDKQNPMIRFYVEDTGIGIPAESHKHIFLPFRQVEETNTRHYGGTGVGLSISKRLIELIGGEIWLTSKLGVGSTFFFTIPFNNDTSDTSLRNKLISKLALIVEDDEYSYEFLKIILEGYGMKTIYAKNGEQAISNCKEYPGIDVILLDINMPVMNGLEAASEIRKFNKDVKIIAQTAYAFEENKNEAIDSGCNDFMNKPIDKDILLNLLIKHTI